MAPVGDASRYQGKLFSILYRFCIRQRFKNLFEVVIRNQAVGLEPYQYLRHVFTELHHAEDMDAFEVLLLWNNDSTQNFRRSTSLRSINGLRLFGAYKQAEIQVKSGDYGPDSNRPDPPPSYRWCVRIQAKDQRTDPGVLDAHRGKLASRLLAVPLQFPHTPAAAESKRWLLIYPKASHPEECTNDLPHGL